MTLVYEIVLSSFFSLVVVYGGDSGHSYLAWMLRYESGDAADRQIWMCG